MRNLLNVLKKKISLISRCLNIFLLIQEDTVQSHGVICKNDLGFKHKI